MSPFSPGESDPPFAVEPHRSESVRQGRFLGTAPATRHALRPQAPRRGDGRRSCTTTWGTSRMTAPSRRAGPGNASGVMRRPDKVLAPGSEDTPEIAQDRLHAHGSRTFPGPLAPRPDAPGRSRRGSDRRKTQRTASAGWDAEAVRRGLNTYLWPGFLGPLVAGRTSLAVRAGEGGSLREILAFFGRFFGLRSPIGRKPWLIDGPQWTVWPDEGTSAPAQRVRFRHRCRILSGPGSGRPGPRLT